MNKKMTLGLVGARGYTGAEILKLIQDHPGLELSYASSRELAGQAIAQPDSGIVLRGEFEHLDPEDVAQRGADICVLALPNGLSEPYVQALDQARPGTIIVDLSADHRFDKNWYYGLPELTRGNAAGKTRISNPGCYATAMQLALAPLRPLLQGPAHCAGVSGYSGAGTTPSEKNDPQVLRENLLPYAPVGHVHEAEVSHQLGIRLRFMPHVAAFFRGINMTVCAELSAPVSNAQLSDIYNKAYGDEPLVKLQEKIPYVRDNACMHHATVGGWTTGKSEQYAVVYVTLDNLLKGAATQAIQNINLACGFDELEGIPHG
ncbi:MAG: N-acetyl-gamma-glutamyl-phosphate reductase [Chromatiales bacterium]|nr:N-acetyl-gamma-glutamyl-phosphate reductase [Chromatiales bacterium]